MEGAEPSLIVVENPPTLTIQAAAKEAKIFVPEPSPIIRR
jgi:hypothetical protein